MDAISLLAVEVGMSLLLSFIVVAYLRNVLLRLLNQSCPNDGGRFWIEMLSLLQFLAPLLLVIWRSDIDIRTNPVLEIKNAFGWMLLGHCIALAMLSRIVWKTLVAPSLYTDNKTDYKKVESA